MVLLLKINGLPIDDSINGVGLRTEDVDEAVHQIMSQMPITNYLYEYSTGFVGDMLHPPVTIAKYVGKAIWNDLDSMGEVVYEHWFPALIHSVVEVIIN